MKHLINWIEIPVTDMDRAKNFYSDILGGITFMDYPMDDPSDAYAIFPTTDHFNAGALVKSAFNMPSSQGVTIYLDGGKNMDGILEKAAQLGGTVIMPKTLLSEESGHIALFIDSEGNKIGIQHKQS